MQWLALVALAVVVIAPAEALNAAQWVEHLEWLSAFAVGGIVVGYVAARTPLRAFAAHALALGIGFELAVIRYAGFASGGGWDERLAALYRQIYQWIEAALRGGASNDNLMFAMTLAMLCWTLGYFGTWYLLRARSPWWGVLPAGTILLLNCSYDTALLPYFYGFLAASLLLLAAVDTWRRRESHQDRRVPHHSNFVRGTLLGGAVLALPLLLVAWQFPPLNADEYLGDAWVAANPTQGLQTRFERLYSAVQARQGGVRALAFARTMAPRQAFELGETQLLAIEASRPEYWRANTLDLYSGQNMASSDVAERAVGPGAILDMDPADEARELMVQKVQVLASQTSAVFAAEQPVDIQTNALLEFRETPRDFASLRLASPLRKGDEYVVTSSVSIATAQELRGAGVVYPRWVASRYLGLPTDLPERVRAEGVRLVGDAATPYDKAIRIESYLRTFPYTTTDIPVPPVGRDWVDYMLFDAKRGYCDYYATSMAVLLRSQGIPARVAQGFATGEWIPERGVYLVRENQAHSWVEVYFPKFGWIVFEPSASRPVPFRVEQPVDPTGLSPLGMRPEDDPALTDDSMAALQAQREMERQQELGIGGVVIPGVDLASIARALLLAVLAVAAVTAVVGGILFVAWNRGLRGLVWHQRLYLQTLRLSSWCGLPVNTSQTPYEQARIVGTRVPGAAPLASTIADAYVAGTYGLGASDELRLQSDSSWRILRVLLPRVTLRQRMLRAFNIPIQALRRAARLRLTKRWARPA